MRNSIVIMGAGGHSRVVADVALACGYKKIIFLDDADIVDVELAGKIDDFVKHIGKSDFFVAIGNNAVRERVTDRLINSRAEVVSLIHPSAVIGNKVTIGKGVFVAPGVVINTGTVIGDGTILNTSSSVDHDCVIKEFCHISVGSHLAGSVKVGRRTFVGAGATIINNISISGDIMIGAGAAVIKNIEFKGTYVGVPAVKIKD